MVDEVELELSFIHISLIFPLLIIIPPLLHTHLSPSRQVYEPWSRSTLSLPWSSSLRLISDVALGSLKTGDVSLHLLFHFPHFEKKVTMLMRTPCCLCVCKSPTVWNFECLNQSLWNLVCISRHVSPSQRRTS
jgi:hypothetical protein